MGTERYGDPRALRLALRDRLRPLARDLGAEPGSLQRQFAYDRLLCRVFTAEPERWVLKGATAMLARLGGRARHTRDIDLHSCSGSLIDAELALRAAAVRDLNDYFSFTLSSGRMIAQGAGAMRVDVVAYLGLGEFARFHVDLAAGLAMTGSPEEATSLVPLQLPGIKSVTYRVYPIADHLADKLCALLEVHTRASGLRESSTRYRDFADLAVFAHRTAVGAEELTRAIAAEARRRSLTLPDRLAAPEGRDWPAGYAKVAREVPDLRERDLASALATVGLLIDPVLAGSARGTWDPATLKWRADRAATI